MGHFGYEIDEIGFFEGHNDVALVLVFTFEVLYFTIWEADEEELLLLGVVICVDELEMKSILQYLKVVIPFYQALFLDE